MYSPLLKNIDHIKSKIFLSFIFLFKLNSEPFMSAEFKVLTYETPF